MDHTDKDGDALATGYLVGMARTMTVPKAGEVLGIGRSAAYEAARRGDIPTIRIGRSALAKSPQMASIAVGSAAGRVATAVEGAMSTRPRHQTRWR